LTTDTQRTDVATAVAIQPNNGRIVVAGSSNLTSATGLAGFAVARYHAFTCNGANVTILGTNGPDTIFGRLIFQGLIVNDNFNDVIHGLGGDDIIHGLGGNDIICGGGGSDTLIGGPGDDVLIGGANGFDVMDGGLGNDTCVGSQRVGLLFFLDPGDSFTGCETINTGLSGLSGEWLEVAQHCDGSRRHPSCRLRGSLRVFNPGSEGTAVRSLVAFYLSEDEVLDANDTFLTTEQVSALDVGKQRIVRLNHKLAGAGNLFGRFVIAVVDYLDNVPEVNEENNVVVSPPL
jgi:Ca2+-binding RTX toxin-like protein